MTLLELMIAVGILGTILMVSSQIGVSSGSAYRQASSGAELSAKAKLVVDRVAMELQIASVGTFFPDLDAGVQDTSNLTFQQLIDINAGVPVYGGPDPNEVMSLQLRLANGEVDDGVDNDGDGLVDEQELVLTRNVGADSQVATVLCANIRERLEGEVLGGGDENGNGLVDEAGFNIERDGNVLTVRLSVVGTDFRGGPMIRSAETAVRLRN